MRSGRRVGYVVAIVINVIALFILHSIPGWNLSFITASFPSTLWAFDLSIGATIVANVLFLAYDAPWFRHLAQLILNVFGFIVVYTLYTVFPFDFGATGNTIVRILLIIGMVGLGISEIVELVGLLRNR